VASTGGAQILVAFRGLQEFIATLQEAPAQKQYGAATPAQKQRAAATSRYATLRTQLRNVHLMDANSSTT